MSKRVAALERELGVRLFARTARGVQLTADGQALLPHARGLLRAADRAAAAVRPGQRPLRVDVPGRRYGPARLLRAFADARPGTELDVVTLADAGAAIAAIDLGAVDASLRALNVAPRRLPAGIASMRALDEPHQFLTGPRHPLAAADAVTPAQLSGCRIWMASLPAGSEWAAFFEAAAAAFGLHIELTHPRLRHRAVLGRDRRVRRRGHPRRRADCGPPGHAATTCAVSRSGTRPSCIPTRCSGTRTTPTRTWPRCASTSARPHPLPAPGRRAGRRSCHNPAPSWHY